jgi:leader peptidase (prepilin peptidase)/N-methyltransferase
MTASPWLILAALVVGTIVGSFIGLVVARLPHGLGVVGGRSRCDDCGVTLSPAELIPIVSYLRQGGRCRSCDGAIDRLSLIAELAGASIAVLALLRGGSPGGALALALFGWSLVALALLDLGHFWLPNRLTLPLLGLGFAAVLALPEIGLGARLVGAALGYGGLELMRRAYHRLRGFDGVGAGDPKLFGAIGAWLGPSSLAPILLAAATIGLVFVAVDWARGTPVDRYRALPFGTLLSLATVLLMPLIRVGG